MKYRLLGSSGLRVSELSLGKQGSVAQNLRRLPRSRRQFHVQQLDEASAIPLGFPHDFYRHEMVRNFVFGGMRDQILA